MCLGGITRQDASSTCKDDQIHGYPPSIQRQPGDMGNITVSAQGTVTEIKILGQGMKGVGGHFYFRLLCLIRCA
jgi:hypothetical protein